MHYFHNVFLRVAPARRGCLICAEAVCSGYVFEVLICLNVVDVLGTCVNNNIMYCYYHHYYYYYYYHHY